MNMTNLEIIKILTDVDGILNSEGYKLWCQIRLDLSSAIKELEEKEAQDQSQKEGEVTNEST